jgi:hypothetical protein
MLMAISSSSKHSSPRATATALMPTLSLTARGISVDLQILDNKTSAVYKEAIAFKWKAKFQLVPPDIQCNNWPEHTICTFITAAKMVQF